MDCSVFAPHNQDPDPIDLAPDFDTPDLNQPLPIQIPQDPAASDQTGVAPFPSPQATTVMVAGAALITLFRNQFAKTKEERRLSLDAIAEIIKNTRAKTKARLPWLKCARFGDKRSAHDCLRNNANVLAITGVEGDHDDGGMSFDEARRRARQSGVKLLLYTTASHTEANPRWRAIAVFSKELDPKQRDQMMNRLAGIFGEGVFAGESWTLSQAYHYGGVTGGTPPQVFITNGAYIDLRDDLDATAIGKTRKAPASTATIAPIVILTGVRPTQIAVVKPTQATRSRLNAAALSALVNMHEIRAASKHIPPMDYRRPAEGGGYGWFDDWTCSTAAAIAWAPEYKAELRSIFDETNRRTANQDKINEWEAKHPGKKYFDSALKTLDKAAEEYWDRVGEGEKVSHFTQIFQVALNNGWDGRTELHLRAANSNVGSSTTVVGGQGAGPDQGDHSLVTNYTPLSGRGLAVAPVQFDTASLYPIDWRARGLLLCGDLTVLAGQGGSAKTAFALYVAVAGAAGRQSIGPYPISNRPGGLRILFLSAEENQNRTGLLVAAAADSLALTASERSLVAQNLIIFDARANNWRIGKPRPGYREEMVPEEFDQALADLKFTLAAERIDILILDTFAQLFAVPSENDNNAVTDALNRATRAVQETKC